jgi:hypothetical protein
LLRSSTSIGANYREANRGVSRADLASKIGTVQKEAAETQYWLELTLESSIRKPANGTIAPAGNRVAGNFHEHWQKAERRIHPVFYFLNSTFYFLFSTSP